MAQIYGISTKPSHPSRRTRTEAGFTLVELLISAIITAVVVGGSVATWQVATRSSRIGGAQAQLESLIDEHLASINALNERYSCCPGSCTATAGDITAATSCEDKVADGTNDERYYSPKLVWDPTNPGAVNTAMDNFRDACATGTIADNFIAAFPPLPTSANPSISLVHTTPTMVDDPSTVPPYTHRVQWAYNGTVDGRPVVVNRVVDIIPTVASWCP